MQIGFPSLTLALVSMTFSPQMEYFTEAKMGAKGGT